MLVPAGITVLAAFLASLRYPFTRRYNEKLSRLLCMREVGDDNDALARQVDKVMSGKRRRPIGTHSVMAILRPFFRHRLQGREALDEALRSADGPVVFLCNHGEFYGPVAGMLFIPVDVRPWTISEIVDDAEEMARYFHKYTISPITWIPEKMKMPLCLKFFGPLSVWAMDQLEAIPVYRNKPTMLMKTMRLSVEALQAGDNILIFPENPDADVDNRGYEHSGLGTLFSGFALLAEIYFNRTGKRLHFVPMYCHKGRRTMTFGQQIVYDPENESAAERERISGEAEQEMRRIWAQEEALYPQETRAKHRRQH